MQTVEMFQNNAVYKNICFHNNAVCKFVFLIMQSAEMLHNNEVYENSFS